MHPPPEVDALLARSVSVVDSFDDIDDMAPIGAQMDAVHLALCEYRDRSAVLSVKNLIDNASFSAVFDVSAPTAQVARLTKRFGCRADVVERLLMMDAARYIALANDPATTPAGVSDLYAQVEALADELGGLIAPHEAVLTVPDTVPAGWL